MWRSRGRGGGQAGAESRSRIGWGHARPGVQMAIASAQPGASANDLTDERQLDAVSGNAALNGVPVRIQAA